MTQLLYTPWLARWVRRLVLATMGGLGLWALNASGAASEFDHLRTGFALTGTHQNQRCESCHLGGVFKGTPKECEACHTSGARFARTNTVKPATHIPSAQGCDTCHNTRSFSGAKMDHKGVSAGSCASCHNGALAAGKPADHLTTTAACDSCHRTSAWKPATAFNHAGVAAGSCASCHNGQKATGKPASHPPYTAVAATASLACDSCHKAGFTAWMPAKVHANASINAQCAVCHLSVRPANALHNGQTVCESCHKSTNGWASGKVDHASFNAATDCASCHNGSTATGKSTIHIPTGSTSCLSCHSTGSWKPGKWNHTQLSVVNQCASCHSGAFPPADGKPATHTPYQLVGSLASLNCDSCHKAGFTAWAPARLHASVSVKSQCSTCHLPIRPSTAIHSGQTVCESCHTSTSSWAGGKVDHSTFNAATQCASCHNGSAATGKPAAHIPVGATNCIACHGTSGWKPSKWNHTQVTVSNQCSSCHSGAFPPADGKPATHTPYQLVGTLSALNCDSCHKAGFAAWAPAKLHASTSIASQCSTCHLSVRPSTTIHSGQTVCENCHKSTSSWAGGKVDHSTFNAATNCSSCHNGSAATGKPAAHIPVGATNCIACHSTSGWKPSKWNHTQVTVSNQCSSCHSGAFPPADGKPATHTPYQLVGTLSALNCDSCHKAGFASWTPARLHASVSVTSQCSSCHLSARPATAVHAGQTVCENCHKSTSSWVGAKVDHSGFTVATNCSSCHNGSAATGKPAAHIPVGATNCIACHGTSSWKPTKWNHTQVTVVSQCSSCHSGAYPPADGRPASHIPYQLLTGVAINNCDSCHKSGYASWAGGRFHANVSVSGQCKTCHSGAYTSQGATAKPSNHIPETQLLNGSAMECSACHTSTTSWAQKMNHNGSQGSGAGWCKACHASGTTYLGSMDRKSLTHRTKTPVPTDCSESGCHRPLGSRGSTYIKWD